MNPSPTVYRSTRDRPHGAVRPVVTIGNFDGVHRGHQALVSAARELAGPHGRVCVLTFDPSPREVLQGVRQPALQPIDERVAALGQAGADEVVVQPFSTDLAALSAEDFCATVLLSDLDAGGLVVGWDFRFGRGRAGDVDLLRRLSGVPVVQVSGVEVDGDVVSSSRVRRLVAEGDVVGAARLLGRPHRVSGRVVHGDARGRQLGFPTANLVSDSWLLPAHGVYAVRVDVDGAQVDGVANLGVRPTFAGRQLRVEVHLLDFAADLYDRTLRVAFVARVREERAFAGLDALVAQIADDVASARRLLAAAP